MQEEISSKKFSTTKLMTVKELAAMIGCSEKTIYSWAETDYAGIPTIKFGKGRKSLLRFNPEEILEWIKSWKRTSTDDKDLCYNKKAETVAKPRKGGK